MKGVSEQGELFTLIWERPDPHKLRVYDVIRLNGRLGRIIRVNDCAAVVLMHRPARQFVTRFDKPVRFAQSPQTFRISPFSEVEILNRPVNGRKPRKRA